MKTAILFPGQGSQSPGMCSKLYHNYDYVRSLWGDIDDVLGFSLSECILSGDEEILKRTSITQPALFMASISAWKVLEKETDISKQDIVVSGHSVGEYAALVSAGSMDAFDAVRLLAIRGKLMESQVVDGGLLALVGGTRKDVDAAVIRANEACAMPCAVALCNSDAQHVVGGPSETLCVLKNLVEAPIKRAIPLSVSGPFHTSYMQAAQDLFVKELDKVKIEDPKLPFASSVSGKMVLDASGVRNALEMQTTGPVLWAQTMHSIGVLGISAAYEVGPGSVLTNLMKRLHPDVVTRSYEEIIHE